MIRSAITNHHPTTVFRLETGPNGLNTEMVSATELGDVFVTTIEIESLDAANVTAIKAQFNPMIDGRKKVVLDMSKVSFLDSSGFGMILSGLRRLSAGGGDLRIAGATNPVKALFSLVRMDSVIRMYPTLDEAVASYAEA